MRVEEILLYEYLKQTEQTHNSYIRERFGEEIKNGMQDYSLKSMEKYAKQKSIKFCKWVQSFENLSRCREFHNCETNEQIYDLFIQSNKQ